MTIKEENILRLFKINIESLEIDVTRKPYSISKTGSIKLENKYGKSIYIPLYKIDSYELFIHDNGDALAFTNEFKLDFREAHKILLRKAKENTYLNMQLYNTLLDKCRKRIDDINEIITP